MKNIFKSLFIVMLLFLISCSTGIQKQVNYSPVIEDIVKESEAYELDDSLKLAFLFPSEAHAYTNPYILGGAGPAFCVNFTDPATPICEDSEGNESITGTTWTKAIGIDAAAGWGAASVATDQVLTETTHQGSWRTGAPARWGCTNKGDYALRVFNEGISGDENAWVMHDVDPDTAVFYAEFCLNLIDWSVPGDCVAADDPWDCCTGDGAGADCELEDWDRIGVFQVTSSDDIHLAGIDVTNNDPGAGNWRIRYSYWNEVYGGSSSWNERYGPNEPLCLSVEWHKDGLFEVKIDVDQDGAYDGPNDSTVISVDPVADARDAAKFYLGSSTSLLSTDEVIEVELDLFTLQTSGFAGVCDPIDEAVACALADTQCTGSYDFCWTAEYPADKSEACRDDGAYSDDGYFSQTNLLKYDGLNGYYGVLMLNSDGYIRWDADADSDHVGTMKLTLQTGNSSGDNVLTYLRGDGNDQWVMFTDSGGSLWSHYESGGSNEWIACANPLLDATVYTVYATVDPTTTDMHCLKVDGIDCGSGVGVWHCEDEGVWDPFDAESVSISLGDDTLCDFTECVHTDNQFWDDFYFSKSYQAY